MIDLHLHSTASDGTFSPEELASYAHSKGLTAISLTDHDTVSGLLACQKVGQSLGLRVISGVELSASYGEMELHILGYNIDAKDPHFLTTLNKLATSRRLRNELIIEKLQALNLPITLSDLSSNALTSPVFTRAHFAKALVEKGYVAYSQQAFDRYLGTGKPAYVPKSNPEVKSCIELIHSVGGKAVLAHPTLYKLSKVRIYNLILQLISLGLDGVECIYPSYRPSQSKDFLNFCKKNHLICTGGSDFHGANKPRLDLGSGYGNLEVPDSFLEVFN